MDVFSVQANVVGFIFLALAVVKVWAVVDAIARPAQAFHAADKQTKTAWLWITGLALAAHLLPAAALDDERPWSILSLIGTIAAFVYLLDVKPALSAVTRRR